MRNPIAAYQCSDKISLGCKRPCQAKLNDGEGEDYECLDQVPTTPFLDAEGIGSHQSDLLGQVPNNGQQTGDEEADADVVNVGIDIAPAVARPPGPDVVVSPDEGVRNRFKIRNLDVQNEHHCCKFSISIEQTERHEAGQVGNHG